MLKEKQGDSLSSEPPAELVAELANMRTIIDSLKKMVLAQRDFLGEEGRYLFTFLSSGILFFLLSLFAAKGCVRVRVHARARVCVCVCVCVCARAHVCILLVCTDFFVPAMVFGDGSLSFLLHMGRHAHTDAHTFLYTFPPPPRQPLN